MLWRWKTQHYTVTKEMTVYESVRENRAQEAMRRSRTENLLYLVCSMTPYHMRMVDSRGR
jgi:hypothetical protein